MPRTFLIFYIGVLLMFTACKKDPSVDSNSIENPVIEYNNINGTWKMVSHLYYSTEVFNTLQPWYDGNMETSCGTEISYTTYQQAIEYNLIIDDSLYSANEKSIYYRIDYDSSYNSCELQCCIPDTTTFSNMITRDVSVNPGTQKITFTYLYQPGGPSSPPLLTTNTFSILKLTENT